MKRNICLSIFGVIFISLIMLTNGLSSTIEAAAGDELLVLDGIDPTDMSQYYSVGEYYPPDNIDTLNINWVGGRVEIIGYNDDDYFVEEGATRYLMEDERLSYTMEDNVFSVYYVSSEDVVIDDAFKKIEIRVPKQLSDKLKSVSVNTNGEVVFRNFTADNITVNNINSKTSFENAYAKNTVIETEGGDVNLKVDNETGYSVDFKTKRGKLFSYIDNGKNNYICGDGTYSYSVHTKTGNFNIELLTEI